MFRIQDNQLKVVVHLLILLFKLKESREPAPITAPPEQLISKLRLTKITENKYSYESHGTIIITSNKIDSMEIFEIGRGQNKPK